VLAIAIGDIAANSIIPSIGIGLYPASCSLSAVTGGI
jgi:hypothetical protein